MNAGLSALISIALHQGHILQTWIYFDPSTDQQLHK